VLRRNPEQGTIRLVCSAGFGTHFLQCVLLNLEKKILFYFAAVKMEDLHAYARKMGKGKRGDPFGHADAPCSFFKMTANASKPKFLCYTCAQERRYGVYRKKRHR
jgi:hypothetical protein